MDLIDMTDAVLVASPQDGAADTVRALADRKLDVAVVVDKTGTGARIVGQGPGQVVGIVSKETLADRTAGVADADRAQMRIGEMMSPVESVPMSTPVVDAAHLMRDRRLRNLALVDTKGMFVGLVGLRRVLFEVMDELDLKIDAVERELMADGPGG